MTDFETCLKALSAKLSASGIRAPLFGGFVLPVYGVERLTLDMDFLLAEEDLPRFASLLAELEYAMVFKNAQYAKFRNPCPAILDIDTVFATSDTVAAIWQNGVTHSLSGAEFLCVSLDILIGTKLHAVRYNETRRGNKDFNDLLSLIEANSLNVAAPDFKMLCEKYGTVEIYDRIRKEIP